MKILLIDNSVVSYHAWHTMHGANYEAETGLELAEYARNYAKHMLYLHSLFQPDRTYVLLDCNRDDIWRHRPYTEYYHRPEAHCTYFKDDMWYSTIEDKVFRWVRPETTERWVSFKLKKADQPAFAATDEKEPDDPELSHEILLSLPAYKKCRKVTRWDYETSREDYKMRSLRIAHNFAPLIKAVVVEQKELEADDLAYCVIRQFEITKHQFVCVTSDSDWGQLCTRNKNVEIYDPIKREMLDAHCGRMAYAMWVKLIGGDAADGIPGIRLVDSKSVIGPTKAAKLVDQHGLDGIYAWLKANAFLPSLERNLKLISFKHIPAELEKAASLSLVSRRPERVKYELDKFGVTESARSLRIADAERDRMAIRMKSDA